MKAITLKLQNRTFSDEISLFYRGEWICSLCIGEFARLYPHIYKKLVEDEEVVVLVKVDIYKGGTIAVTNTPDNTITLYDGLSRYHNYLKLLPVRFVASICPELVATIPNLHDNVRVNIDLLTQE